MTRDERQEECVKNWIKYKGRACVLAATGFGKTRIAMIIIHKCLNKNPNFNTVVLVPTDYLRKQWKGLIKENSLEENVKVESYNWAINNYFSCDLLICDECHTLASESRINIIYKNSFNFFLGLTATINRIDEREQLLLKHFPICDCVNLDECKKNGWIAEFKEYKVLLDVDLMEYNIINEQYNNHFSFFNFDWNKVQYIFGKKGIDYSKAKKLSVVMNCSDKEVILHATNVMRLTRKRKDWCYNHPKKIDLSRKIVEYRSDKKILTFSQSIKIASMLPYGSVVHSKLKKKEINNIIDKFNQQDIGILHSVKSMSAGCDINGLSVGIITSLNSSQIDAKQILGRSIRKEGDKKSEIFNLIIKGTIEEAWFQKSHIGSDYITIYENQLEKILKNEEVEIRRRREVNLEYIF